MEKLYLMQKQVLLRVFRLDDSRKRIPCTCTSNLTLEPSYECKFCSGEGYFGMSNGLKLIALMLEQMEVCQIEAEC